LKSGKLPFQACHGEYTLWQAAERGPDLDFIVNDCPRSAQRTQPVPKIPCGFSCYTLSFRKALKKFFIAALPRRSASGAKGSMLGNPPRLRRRAV